MPIQISYPGSAGDIAGTALLGGQGQYAQNVNQLLTQQWQTAAGIQNARMMAMAQAAQEAQQQQNQQQFELAKMPMQAGIQAQQMQYQNQLGMQADAQQQALHDYYGGQQSQQDFAEQQDLSAQNAQQQRENQAAQIQLQQQGDLAKQQQMSQYKSDTELMQSFQDGSYQKRLQQIQQQATRDGSDYTPEQKQQIQTHQNTLAAAQAAVGPQEGMGSTTSASVRPAVKDAMTALSNIYSNPGQPKPPSPAQQFSQGTAWYQPNASDPSQIISDTPTPGAIPVQKNANSNQWESKIIKPGDMNRSKQNDEALQDVKVLDATYKAKKSARELEGGSLDKINRQIEKEKANYAATNYAAVPQGWEEQRRAQLMQEQQQANAAGDAAFERDRSSLPQRNVGPQRAQAPGEAAAGMAGGQSPPGAVNPRLPANDSSSGQPGWNAQQQHPAAGIPAQAQSAQPPEQSQPAASPQQPQLSIEHAKMVHSRLKNTPRDKWSPHDWILWSQALQSLGALQPAQ